MDFKEEFADWLEPVIIGKIETTIDDDGDPIEEWKEEHQTVGYIRKSRSSFIFEADRDQYENIYHLYLPLEDNDGDDIELDGDMEVVLADSYDDDEDHYEIKGQPDVVLNNHVEVDVELVTDD